jgi:hypothetical protein
MQENVLIVVDQAVNKCLDLDLTNYKQIEIIVGASQKTLPVEFVRELLRIQSKCGVPVDLLATKGTGSHHVEMYLAWLLGRHIEKLPDGNITVIANGIDADSLLDNCIDEEYHHRISILSEDAVIPAAKSVAVENKPVDAKVAEIKETAKPVSLDKIELEKPASAAVHVAKKPEIELVPTKTELAEDNTKQLDSKLISKLMQKKEILEARHPITGEPLPEPLNK